MFHGCITALVTPFDSMGQVDWSSLEKMLFFQLDKGVETIVLLGSTGEGWSLTETERKELLQQTRKWVGSRAALIVGTGQTGTRDTIQQTQAALSAQADAVLVVTPPYNKPSQEGLYQHYKAIAEAVPIPLILYNVPSRTGIDLKPETVFRLADIPNVVALKEAVTEPNRTRTLIQGIGSRLDILTGDDPTAFDALAAGAKGVISVTSNLLPAEVKSLCDLIFKGNLKEAFELQERLLPLHHDLFVESNPIPVKWALFHEGLIGSPMVRLPLLPLSHPGHQAKLARHLEALFNSGALKG